MVWHRASRFPQLSCMTMLYSTLVKGAFRSWYGEPPDLSAEHEGQGLVLVADGVGGLDLCGTALRYVMGSLGVKYTVRVVPWGHGFGRWHADLTNVQNRDTRASGDRCRGKRLSRAGGGRSGLPRRQVGGTGLVVKAAEHLPGAVEAAVLLSPALSPRYDLTQALRGR